MNPYYEADGITIYHGDCRDVLPVEADVLVTDPPYGIGFRSGWTNARIQGDEDVRLRDEILTQWLPRPALIFGVAGEATLPGALTTLIWWRPGSGMGNLALPWKPDYELIHVFGDGWATTSRGSSVFRFPWDVFRGDAGHPHRKPIGLMHALLVAAPSGVILDPFMGSGTTLVAAKNLGRKAIGIEIVERYCEIAAKRLAQGVLDFGGVA